MCIRDSCIGDETYATLVFRTDVLRSIINSLDYTKSVKGGDHNASKMYLLNIQKLFSSDVIKAFRERNKDVKDRETIESSVEERTKI